MNMGGTLTWWILGALVVGGGAVVYMTTRDGKKKDVTQVCVKELPDPYFTQVKATMDAKDVATLNAFAIESRKKGWLCAADELEAASERAKKSALDPAIAKLCIDDLPEPMRSDVKGAIATNDFVRLNGIALSIAFSGGNSCALDEVKAAAKAAKTAVDSVPKTTDPVSDPKTTDPVDVPKVPVTELFDGSKTYTTSSFDDTASSPYDECMKFYDSLTESEQGVVQTAISIYRNGNKYYPKGTTSDLSDLADDFQTRGDWQFANCLRIQAGLPLKYPVEIESDGGGDWSGSVFDGPEGG